MITLATEIVTKGCTYICNNLYILHIPFSDLKNNVRLRITRPGVCVSSCVSASGVDVWMV